jgi:hypothetical protein
MGVVESGSDRARRDAEDIGNHRGLVPEVIAEDEDGSLLRRKPAERAVDDVSIDDARELVGCRGAVEGQNLEMGVPASVTASVLDAHVRDEALDPEVESVRIAEVRKVTPGDHQRVLQGILGPIDIPENPASDRVQAVDPRSDEVEESDLISALGRDDKLSIHRRHSLDVHRGRRPFLRRDRARSALEFHQETAAGRRPTAVR